MTDSTESSRLAEQLAGLDILSSGFGEAMDGLSVSQRNAAWTALTRESRLLTKTISDLDDQMDDIRTRQHTLQMRRRRLDFIRGELEARGVER